MSRLSAPVLTETTDAPAGRGTPYRLTAGGQFDGTITRGDHDWIAIDVTAGQRYDFRIEGRTGAPIYDSTLTLRDASGAAFAFDDDGGTGYLSALSFTATTTGRIYLDVGGYDTASTGGYSLTADLAPQSRDFTPAQIAAYLTDGFWAWAGEQPRSFAAGTNTLTVDLSNLTADGKRLARAALDAWSAVSSLRFVDGGSNAQITFDDNDSGAYSTSVTSGTSIVNSHVNISLDWLAAYGTGFSSYSYQTYIHEIGHALGLGHSGPYNGTATWGVHDAYRNDSTQLSIMSYFRPSDNPNVNATDTWLGSPMMADILAIRDLYGRANERTGNDTYGDTGTGAYAIAARMLRAGGEGAGFTIVDDGGIDTLSLAGYGGAQVIDLKPGAFSSAYGERDNIAIMLDTRIENAVGGGGNDVLRGNVVANRLTGGAGNDTLMGFDGNDTLIGGPGRDRLEGGRGDDTYIVSDTGDVIIEQAGFDTVRSSVGFTLPAGVEALILTGTALRGTGNALNNVITGNIAGNTLTGGAGADTLRGFAGNDTYYVDSADTVIEAAQNGYDHVIASGSFIISANIEYLTLTGTAQRGDGNAQNNTLTGNDAANHLAGWAGNDILRGGGGADRLVGGAGNDTLTGGAGADVFVFSAGVDRITDFTNDVDTISIARSLVGAAATVAQVLSLGRIEAGAAVFDFGGGNRLEVAGVKGLGQLSDDLVLA